MRRKKRLEWERHQEIGSVLCAAARLLVSLSVEVSTTYGVTSKAAKQVDSATTAINRLRSELDNRLFQEHGERADAELKNTYYGRRENRPFEKIVAASYTAAELQKGDV